MDQPVVVPDVEVPAGINLNFTLRHWAKNKAKIQDDWIKKGVSDVCCAELESQFTIQEEQVDLQIKLRKEEQTDKKKEEKDKRKEKKQMKREKDERKEERKREKAERKAAREEKRRLKEEKRKEKEEKREKDKSKRTKTAAQTEEEEPPKKRRKQEEEGEEENQENEPGEEEEDQQGEAFEEGEEQEGEGEEEVGEIVAQGRFRPSGELREGLRNSMPGDIDKEDEMLEAEDLDWADAKKMQLYPEQGEQLIGHPLFKKLMENRFVRFKLSQTTNDYLVGFILGHRMNKDDTYKFRMPQSQGGAWRDLYFDVLANRTSDHGSHVANIKLNEVSNSPITLLEWQLWWNNQGNRDKLKELAVTSRTSQLMQRRVEIFKNYRLTEDERARWHEERRRTNPNEMGNLIDEKTRLRAEISAFELQGRGGEDEALEKRAQLNDLLNKAMPRLRTRAGQLTMQLDQLTEENKKENDALRRRFSSGGRDEEAEPVYDVYSRIPTRPRIYWSTGGGETAPQKKEAEQKKPEQKPAAEPAQLADEEEGNEAEDTFLNSVLTSGPAGRSTDMEVDEQDGGRGDAGISIEAFLEGE